MGFCVLYYQTIIFTGIYQRWTTYALKPKSVLEMHFLANSKKTQSLEKMAVGKSAWIKACMYMYIYIYIYIYIYK